MDPLIDGFFYEIHADSASQLKLSQHARSKLSKIGVFQRLENQTEIWPSFLSSSYKKGNRVTAIP